MLSNLTASGKKVLRSLAVVVQMILYSLPDGRGVESPCEGLSAMLVVSIRSVSGG